jgi:DNA primase large subunit
MKRIETKTNKIEQDKKISWKQMYNDNPRGNISVEDFEDYGYERLKLLKFIESLKLKKNINKFNLILEEEKKIFGENYNEKDLLSHYILRIPFSKK